MTDTNIRVSATGLLTKTLVQRIEEVAQLDLWEQPEPLGSKQLVERLKEANAVLCLRGDSIDATLMSACPKLRIVANASVGYDNVDMAEANKRAIIVTNTPGVLDDATADLTFALILATARRLAEADRFVREGNWLGFREDLLLGRDLSGKILGIVGMGRIGEAVARRARGFGMSILYTRAGNDEKDTRLKTVYEAERVSLGELLKKSDFISLHCPLNEKTRHLIGARELALMKPDALLINTARGAVINELELVDALKENKIGGAGLDVFEFEPEVTNDLFSLSNVVLAPHIGSATHETRLAMKTLAVDNMLSALSGTLPTNAVNKEVWPQFIKQLSVVR